MKGHIRERGRGTWCVVIELPRGPDGKRHAKWHTVKGTRRDAERERVRLLHEMQTGNYIEASRLTVAEYLQRWLNDCKRIAVSPASFDRYETAVRVHLIPGLGQVPLARLSPLHIQSYYSQQITSGRADGQGGGLAPRSVSFHHQILKQSLRQAVRWQVLAKNPADAVDPPRAADRDMTALSLAEVARVVAAARGTRFYVAILLALTSGMRRNEILALRWQDVDLESGRITVLRSLEKSRQGTRYKEPKTARGRRPVEIPRLMVEALLTHRAEQRAEIAVMGALYQDQGLVVARADGQPHSPAVVSRAFAAIARDLRLPTTRFHDLRHTHATLLLNQGENPKVVSERLGHAGVSITLDRYSHVMPDLQAETAKRLDASLRASLDP